MEPLSITASALTIASRVIPAAIHIHGVWTQYQEAPQTILDLVEELQLLRTCLVQLENVLRRDGVSITLDLEDVFAIAVRGCRATLLCLEQEFDTLRGQDDWWTRIVVLWRDNNIARLLAQLARKKSSIMLLMQCLNLYVALVIITHTHTC
ncbi:hypothetical protein P154DRAFT_448288 [Amniculicola lignicola CBS 123094]|uniref:Azaphilone pigments biosynthesis cluster protein L N-terminal domain-containing protein n=1 Tax=Amniculicola lignicola CBS 123094 TaxID=1392246 RepID=A0A6A5VWQ2_9PLEO|nr:hypothetical protein P154DRAFT_448288 [Amniculicola lignicola CBS 123094]